MTIARTDYSTLQTLPQRSWRTVVPYATTAWEPARTAI